LKKKLYLNIDIVPDRESLQGRDKGDSLGNNIKKFKNSKKGSLTLAFL